MLRQNLKFLAIFLLIFGCLVSAFDSGYAQQDLTPSQLRQLQAQIEKLKHKIVQVEQLLRAFDHALARGFLEEAKKLAQQLESDYRQGRYFAMQTKIRNANAFLDKVLALATDSTLKRLINELNRLMRKAEHEVIGSGNREAERMLQSAKRRQERAEKALHNANIKRVYEQLTVAITFVKKALDLVNTHGGSRDNLCEREHVRFQNLMRRVENIVETSGNSRARRIFEQSLNLFKRAEKECREGKPPLAEEMYNKAIRLLLRAMDIASSTDTIDENNLKHELETVKQLLSSVKSRLENSDQARSGLLLKRIEENIAKAENLIVRGQYRLAKLQLARARRMLESIFRAHSATKVNVQEKAESELQVLQQDIAKLESESVRGNAFVKDFLQISGQVAAQARQDIAHGKYSAALQRILVGQKFIAKAENLQRGGRIVATEAIVDRNIRRLQQLLQEAETTLSTGKNTYATELLADARAMLRQAENKRAEKKYILALELSEVGKELITTAMRMSRSPD